MHVQLGQQTLMSLQGTQWNSKEMGLHLQTKFQHYQIIITSILTLMLAEEKENDKRSGGP